jgi:hypothetical protein
MTGRAGIDIHALQARLRSDGAILDLATAATAVAR